MVEHVPRAGASSCPVHPRDDALAAFIASMPVAYAEAFDREAIAAHAAIVARRSGAVHVESWQELDDGVVAICITADDRPGLLAQISSALVLNAIDVVRAEAYCRRAEHGAIEAVDLLWVRAIVIDVAAPAPRVDVARLEAILGAIVSGLGSMRSPPAPARGISPPAAGSGATVRFVKSRRSGAIELFVEAVDRPGLLLAITRALYRAGVQIVALRARSEAGSATDRFEIAEADGAPLSSRRLLAVQAAILEAMDHGAA